mgnify:CR=1 FL=1
MTHYLNSKPSLAKVKQIVSEANTKNSHPGYILGRYYPWNGNVKYVGRNDASRPGRIYFNFIRLPAGMLESLNIVISSLRSVSSAEINLGLYSLEHGYPSSKIVTQKATINSTGWKELVTDTEIISAGWYALAYLCNESMDAGSHRYSNGIVGNLYGQEYPVSNKIQTGLKISYTGSSLPISADFANAELLDCQVSPIIWVKFK